MMPEINLNTFLYSGFILGAIGGATAILWRIWSFVTSYARRYVVTTIEFLSTDTIYENLDLWLNNISYAKKCRILHIIKNRSQAVILGEDGKKENFIGVPGAGTHIFRHNKIWIILEKIRNQGQTNGPIANLETVKMMLFTRNKKKIQDIIQEIKDTEKLYHNKIKIYSSNYEHWETLTTIDYREPNSVVLPKGQLESVLSDIDKFISNRKYYLDRGIPYRRGICLEGGAGNGKSSLIHVLASHLKYNIAILNLGDRNLDDAKLLTLFYSLPEDTIIVCEDIDSIFDGRKRNSDSKSELTFAGLLNAIDGIASSNGRIFICTTNYYDKLDSALVRSGRIDLRLTFNKPDEYQVRTLSRKFTENIDEIEEIWNIFKKKDAFSMADLQNYLLQKYNL